MRDKKSIRDWKNEFPISTHANYARGTITFRIRHEPRGSSSRAKVKAVADEMLRQIDAPDLLVRRRDFTARVDLEFKLSIDLAKRCMAVQQRMAETARDPNQLSFGDIRPA